MTQLSSFTFSFSSSVTARVAEVVVFLAFLLVLANFFSGVACLNRARAPRAKTPIGKSMLRLN